MSNHGLPYYKVDTDRYDDIRIKKLKKDCGASGIAIYDYILCQIYGGKGYYVVEDEEFVFTVAECLNVKRQNVNEVIGYACATGLFDKELRTRESILTSAAIQERWVQICKKTKRSVPKVDERYWVIKKIMSADNPQMSADNPQMSADNPQMSADNPQMSADNPQMSADNPQMSADIQTERDKGKEIPPTPPYKEKETEKETSLIGVEQPIFAEDEVEIGAKPKQTTLTPAEKRARAIAARKQREETFYNSLIPYVEQYGQEMISEFYNYWSEPTRSGDKMRCEKQETWELTRRLATWAKRTNSYKNGRISSTRSSGGNATTSTIGDSHDRYAEITDFIGQRIV